MKINNKIIRLKQFAKSIFHCERSMAILFALVLVLSLGVMVLPMAETVEASPDSYTTNEGKPCWTGDLLNITQTPPGWSPLAVDVSYADGKATFVITAPVAFDPEAWPNDNFWLSFDTNIDGAEDFQVGYNTQEPGTEMGGWPEHPTEHWFYKFGVSWYQLIPDDWDVFETGLSEFTVSIPVSYLGGANSNYEFQIGLVKWVYETDWQTEWGNVEFDPICEGWSTSALIFVPLPTEGWESETAPNNDATLSDLTVDGETIAGFDSSILTYNEVLPHGTTEVPTVGATTTDSNASKVITQAENVTGTTAERTATVVVTAEDGSTTETYEIIFGLIKVTITKTGPTTANQGSNITYTITYKNEGTFSATNVVVIETYPAEVEYVLANPEPVSGFDNKWTIGTLAPDVEGTITVTVHIK